MYSNATFPLDAPLDVRCVYTLKQCPKTRSPAQILNTFITKGLVIVWSFRSFPIRALVRSTNPFKEKNIFKEF